MTKDNALRFIKSIWFFPAILTLALLLLTAFGINGSSIGMYHTFFNGEGTRDNSLLFGKPRAIRSDEWNVNTQMSLAQYNNGFERINDNFGNGMDMSVLYDAPYKDWSMIFKPHFWSFFVLPFEQAFAFKWWLLSYLLVMSFYFFTLLILPGRKILATVLSASFLFSPFLQWWYQYVTFAPLYYALFAGIIFLYLMRTKSRAKLYALTLLLAYVLTSFALVLYPPFQIPAAIVLGLVCIGYVLEEYTTNKKRIWKRIACVFAALFITGATVFAFIQTREGVISTITNTTYPGKRIVESGGYSVSHLLSGNLDFQLLHTTKAALYAYPGIGVTNQSAASTFILLIAFLFLPSMVILYLWYKRTGKFDWPLIASNVAFLIFLIWLFVPNMDLLGKLTQLNKVPLNRLIIGMGLLSFIHLILTIRRLDVFDKITSRVRLFVTVYALLVLIIVFALSFHTYEAFPGFIGKYRLIAFSLPIPVIVYFLLMRKYVIAGLILLLFSVSMGLPVNPIYKGTEILSSNSVVNSITDISDADDKRWAVETSYLENFALMSGDDSLTGVYGYPQLDLWKDSGADESIYNRFAHVYLNLDRNSDKSIETSLKLAGEDHFVIITEACSNFLKDKDVKYILTDGLILDSCADRVKTIAYPAATYYIYAIR